MFPRTTVAILSLVLAIPASPVSAADPAHLYDPRVRWEPTAPGDTTPVDITVGNDGGADARVLSGSISGTDADDVAIDSVGAFSFAIVREGSTNSSVALLSFQPTSVGWKEATLTIVYDTDADDELEETASIEIPLRVLATAAPHGIEFEPNELDGGTVKRRVFATSSFTVRNASEIPVTIEEVDGTTGSHTLAPYGDSCDGVTLDAGDTCTVHVRAMSDRIGVHTSRIEVVPSGPFDARRIDHTFRVVDDLSLPDNVEPTMDDLPLTRAVGVRFGESPRITVRQSYQGHDNRGVAGYTVLADEPSGVTRTILHQLPPWPDPLAPVERVDLSMRSGEALMLRVRARDAEGLTSPYETSRDHFFNYRLRDLSGSGVKRSASFARVSGQERFMRADLLRTSSPGANVKVNVDANRFYLVARRSANAGAVQVWLDGRLRATFDLRSSTGSGPAVMGPVEIPLGSDSPHKVKLVARKVGSRTLVEIDSLILQKQR